MRAGFGVAPITPEPPVRLAGFGARTRPADVVRDDLEARALFLESDATRVCLVVCDLLGMTPDVSGRIRRDIAADLGVPIANVLVACTHTHAAPSVMSGTEAIDWPTPSGFVELVTRRCGEAAASARRAAEPGELRYGVAPLPGGIAFNRRGLPYEDPELTVVDVRGADDGRIGALVNIAVHPVSLGPHDHAVSTDWVGPFRAELERIGGGKAIELSGALGDVNPSPPSGLTGDDAYAPWCSPDETTAIAHRLARAAAEALDGATAVAGGLAVPRAETVDLPVEDTPLARLGAVRDIVPVDLVEWAIGDVRLVSLPGEAFHAFGREVSAARGGRTLLAGLSPSWHGYFPHPYGDGYEETLSYGRAAVERLLGALTRAP